LSIKAIIFDVDGTLLNTYEDLAAAVNYALSSNGFAVHPAESYKIFTGNGTDVMIKRALPKESQNDQNIKYWIPWNLIL
jgi:phosphoglycolate phosphatase